MARNEQPVNTFHLANNCPMVEIPKENACLISKEDSIELKTEACIKVENDESSRSDNNFDVEFLNNDIFHYDDIDIVENNPLDEIKTESGNSSPIHINIQQMQMNGNEEFMESNDMNNQVTSQRKVIKENKSRNKNCKNNVRDKNNMESEIPFELLGSLTKRSVHSKEITYKEVAMEKDVEDDRKMEKTNESCRNIISKSISRFLHTKTPTKKIIDSKKRLTTSKCCKVCDISFNYVSEIVEHFTNKHPAFFVCDLCGANFQEKKSIIKHMNLHYGNKIYNCEMCEFTSYSYSSFYTHKKKHLSTKLYKCEYCDFVCQYISILRIHKKVHFSESYIQCSKCDYRTPYPGILKRHQLSHTSERPFQCDTCPFKCKSKYSLELHQRSHSSKFLYKCSICEKGFKWSCALSAHMITHTKEKKYFCNVCSYSTAFVSSLQRHQISHLNALFCSKCSYTTTSYKNLLSHTIRNHKINNLYTCPECGFSSPGVRKALQHKQVHVKNMKLTKRNDLSSKNTM